MLHLCFSVDDIHPNFFPHKNIKLYLCALISVTVNNQGLEINKKLFGMKYEVAFHNYCSTEGLPAGDGQKAMHTMHSDADINYPGSYVCFF